MQTLCRNLNILYYNPIYKNYTNLIIKVHMYEHNILLYKSLLIITMTQIILYTTTGCHLCNIAKRLLFKANQQIPFDIINTEISNDRILVFIYGESIPVIEFENVKQLNWPFKLGDIISNLS